MLSPLRLAAFSLAAGLVFATAATPGFAQEKAPKKVEKDNHAGYYYPTPKTFEEYKARAVMLADSDRSRRIAFVANLTKEFLSRPYPPQLVIFAKGDEKQKLIIVALDENHMNTIFRARAVLAQLTSIAILSPLFQEHGVEEIFTFFDLLKLLGFKQVTISDGKTFAHQVKIH